MSRFAPSTSSLQSIKHERIGQDDISCESQRQRYAFFCYAQQLGVVIIDQRATARIPRRFTSLMMIHSSMYFISFVLSSWAKMRMTIPVLEGVMRDGSASAGGINWRMFARDGEISYSRHRPTWVFASSVQIALPLRTC
jgi:hypothetical protein